MTTLTLTPLTLDDWIAQYQPISNETEQLGMSVDDVHFCFDTHGSDREKVLKALDASPETIWTIMDCDGDWYLVSGYHYVNAMYYAICKVPLTPDDFFEINLED